MYQHTASLAKSLALRKKIKIKKINQIVYLMPVNLHSGTTSGQLKVQRPEL